MDNFFNIEIGEQFTSNFLRVDEHLISIDKQLHVEYNLNGFSAKYIQLLDKRGFSFAEYLSLFDSAIKEDEFHNYIIYRILRIESEYSFWDGSEKRIGRKDFTSIYKPNEEHYLKLLKETTGDTFFRSKREKFRLSSLKGHMHITGETGSGKSQLMRLLIWHIHRHILKNQNTSAILIDVHGDLAKEVKSSSLNKEGDHFVYVSSTFKKGFTPIINPFQIDDENLIDKTSEFIAEAFDELLNNQFSDQMLAILIPCLRVLIKAKNKTFNDLQKFMMDDPNLIQLGLESDIPSHRDFFKYKFKDSNYKKTKLAIYTRIQGLLNSPQFYYMTMGENTVNLNSLMSGGKVVVFDLSGIGGFTKYAMGKFLIAQIRAIAENREFLNKSKRPYTYLFIDEAHNFLSKSIEKTLNEMRKYNLFLIIAHQYIKQLGDLLYSVMSNTTTKVVFYNDEKNLGNVPGYLGVKKDVILKNWKLFECWIKTGRDDAVKIKPSNKLMKKKKYSLTKYEEKELNNKILATYYSKINDTSPIQSTTTSSGNKPLYDLYLGK